MKQFTKAKIQTTAMCSAAAVVSMKRARYLIEVKELQWRCFAVVHKNCNLNQGNILEDSGFSAVSSPTSNQHLRAVTSALQ